MLKKLKSGIVRRIAENGKTGKNRIRTSTILS